MRSKGGNPLQRTFYSPFFTLRETIPNYHLLSCLLHRVYECPKGKGRRERCPGLPIPYQVLSLTPSNKARCILNTSNGSRSFPGFELTTLNSIIFRANFFPIWTQPNNLALPQGIRVKGLPLANNPIPPPLNHPLYLTSELQEYTPPPPPPPPPPKKN